METFILYKRLCFLNIKDDSIFEITNNATAYSSSAKNNNILYAKGFKLFKSDLDGNSKEIILSDEVLQALKKPHYKNIDDFYNNSYNKDYYDEDDYSFMVNNNCISSIHYYKKNLIELKTLDEKRIFYNLDDKSFKVFYDKTEAKKYKNKILKNTEDKNNKKLYKIEENENYKKLYSLDGNFDKKNLIDQGEIFIESISKNNKKIAYKKSINNESKLFIYDFVKDKKTQIFLPDFNVMRWNDDEKIGILMLTAKNNLMDKIKGLELGADDYITKPFDLLELIARIRSLERRLKKSFAQKNIVKKEKENKKYEKGILIKSLERLIYIDGKEIELKPKELDLLIFLVKNNPYVLTREQILTNVWGMDYLGSSRTIDIHIQRLRKKLKNYSTCIQTVPCVGYKIKEFRGKLI